MPTFLIRYHQAVGGISYGIETLPDPRKMVGRESPGCKFLAAWEIEWPYARFSINELIELVERDRLPQWKAPARHA